MVNASVAAIFTVVRKLSSLSVFTSRSTELGFCGGNRIRRVARRHVRIRRPHTDLAVDEATESLVGADDPQSHRVLDQRHVVHRIEPYIAAAVLGVGAFQLDRAFGPREVGLVRDQPDRAAHGTRTVQGTLRTAQHFDAGEIEQVRIDGRVGTVAAGRQDGRLVDVEARRRSVTADGGDAADRITAAAGAGGIQHQRWECAPPAPRSPPRRSRQGSQK